MSVQADKEGLYQKFRVERTDGRSAPGEKHAECRYFVLDLDHDEFALPAVEAYADACESAHPELAADLRRWAYDERLARGLYEAMWER